MTVCSESNPGNGSARGADEAADFVVASLPRSLTQGVVGFIVIYGLPLSEPQKAGGGLFPAALWYAGVLQCLFYESWERFYWSCVLSFRISSLCQTQTLGFLCHKEDATWPGLLTVRLSLPSFGPGQESLLRNLFVFCTQSCERLRFWLPASFCILTAEFGAQGLVMTAVLGFKAVARHPDYHQLGYCLKETSETKQLAVEGRHETSWGTGKVWAWDCRGDFLFCLFI